MIISKPPVFRFKPAGFTKPSIFLAGSIEMGQAEDWQERLTNELGKHYSILYNPRRDQFDPNWKQGIEEPQFNIQVTWELEMIERADVITFFFDPATKAPVSMLELGLAAIMKPHATHVLCPEGFWRKGNVDIVCERYGLKTYENFPKLIAGLCSPSVVKS